MARSKFVWIILYEGGKTQSIKAQTIWQIINNCDKLIDSVDSIILITRMELSSNYDYIDAVDIPFED